jgi:hypothetical protein
MIDYNKLKKAHELAHQARPKNGCISIEMIYPVGSDALAKPYYSINTENSDGMTDEFCFYNVEELIIKLQELANTEIAQPKYKVGDTIWYIGENKDEISSGLISEIIYFNDNLAQFRINDEVWFTFEDELYPTKTALIEAQIQHWQSLLGLQCEHASLDESDLPKCFKCGEFYK